MAQNTSHAVMSQRVEPQGSLDYFPTPPWATRGLCEYLIDLTGSSVWEPACGEGHMAKPLAEYASSVFSSDIENYNYGEVFDFLSPSDKRFDWIITNPPFNRAEEFALTALKRSNKGVALLVRSTFLEGVKRYTSLFSPTPPAMVAQFTERVPMYKGRLEAKGSTATAYCWVIWTHNKEQTKTIFTWVPPCRRRLERSEDYSALPRKI